MNDNTSFVDVVNKIVLNKWRVIIITCSITLLGIVYVVSLPRQYTSTTTIVAEKKNDMSGALGLLGSLGMSDTEPDGLTIDLAPTIISSTPFRLEFKECLVSREGRMNEELPLAVFLFDYQKKAWWNFLKSKKYEEYKSESSDGPYMLSKSDIAFLKITKDMFEVKTDKKTNVMKLSITTQDPMVSVILADSLTIKLQHYLTAYQTNKAKHEFAQSIKIADSAKTRYYHCQELYSEANDRNKNLINAGVKTKIDRLRDDMSVALQAYSATASQVEVARTKLLENTPVYTVIDPPYFEEIPSEPSRKLAAIVSFFFGLFVGVGSVIIGDIKKLVFNNNANDDITDNKLS